MYFNLQVKWPVSRPIQISLIHRKNSVLSEYELKLFVNYSSVEVGEIK